MLFLPILKKTGHLDRVHITVGIVGSRKIGDLDDYASQGWEIFAPNLTIYGFDADAEACNEANADLEARQVNWTEKHIPLALSNTEGKATLYVTKYPGCSSLYPPSEEYIKRFSGNSELIELKSTVDLSTTTLEKFCKAEDIKEIDFLHLDVQGAELKVLQGAGGILNHSVLGLVTEVEFTELYADQPLFSDVDIYLRNQGLTLFDFGHMQRDMRREVPVISNSHPGALIWSDAFYFRDLMRSNVDPSLKTPEKLLKLACLADVMKFPDYALEILEYLTLNYGTDPNYNFANNIIESLGQIPELVEQGLESLPIVARLRDWVSGGEYLKLESVKAPAISKQSLPMRDYISPNFPSIQPDKCFPNMIVGDPNLQAWPYLRRDVPHNWYVDQRQPTVGFLSRDEAHILYNTALKFKGKKTLEIGCWLGWSACHLALAGVELDVIDPLLARPDFYESVSDSLKAAGVLDSVNLVAGSSPPAVEKLATQLQRKWSLIFIDGNHEAPGPLHDAIICEQLAEADALILFHDLASPDVTQGLDYLKQKGWQTMVYQTMQIMGVAWRGNVEPVVHHPDPKVSWILPTHLQGYTVSSMSNNQFFEREVGVRQVQEMMQQAITLVNSNQPVEAMRIAEQAVLLNINVAGMHYLRSICLNNVGRHKEALAAAKEELAINPTHQQAQEQVENLTKAILRSEITIPTQKRSWHTTLGRENMLSIQNATMNYSYRGVPMLKNPFDFAIYPVLIWNLKPRTIIEIGSKDGGSAVWLGDMLNNFGIDGHIYSIDIVKVTSVQHPRVTYMEGNGRALQVTLTPNFLNSLPRPLLVIEDADHSYETSKHVLEFFQSYLKQGEYIVIEDGIISDLVQDTLCNSGPHKALKEFLSEREGEYEIDSSYCDYFGYNLTWCTNGFLKKVKESSSIGDPFLNKLFHYVEEYQPVPQVPSSVDLSGDRQKIAELIQKGKEYFVKGEIETAIATFTQAVAAHQSSLIAHNYLSILYWEVGDVQKSLQHHILSQFGNIVLDTTIADEFQQILSVIRPYTLLSEARLFSLYSLARQICLDDIPGNFVECGSYKGGSAALLAVVIKQYSLRPRLIYAFDTFEGMPEPTEADKHNGIPANLTPWGAGTLKAPLTDNLEVICQSLDVRDIVLPVKGLFAQTLPESKSAVGSISLLHADGDWYESTMDIFNNIYDSVVPNGFIQIDDYGHWDGCKKAIHEFEKRCGQSFALRVIDYTGVWFQKEDSVHQDCNHWRTFWHLAQTSEKMGNRELAKKAAQAVVKIVPKLVKAESLLNRCCSPLELLVSPEISLSAELDDFLNNLRLRDINIILFPNWQQPEESLSLQLEGVITALLAHKEPQKITALIDTSNISEEDANLLLSSVIMDILMQEYLDETDVPEVSLLGNLSEMEWKVLLPCIHYRLVLENENQQAVAQAGAASLPSLKAANLSI